MTPLDRLLARALSASPLMGGMRVVAIDGPSGAGKTTFADDVANELETRVGRRPQVVHMDDIYPGWNGLSEAVAVVAAAVLEPRSRGQDGGFRRWDWLAGERAEWVAVPAADWLVLEGVGCGSRRCLPHLAALAWMEADRDIRMARGIERDGESFRPHWERWALQEAQLFAAEATRTNADVILRT